jgi:hypothetical protein
MNMSWSQRDDCLLAPHTVAIGVVLRIAVQDHDFSVAFTIVATLFVGSCMLGWRAVVLAVQQRRRTRLDA